jgi:GH25 family lysozyme M1 (1,4-beta-N-acetylmuramidase)
MVGSSLPTAPGAVTIVSPVAAAPPAPSRRRPSRRMTSLAAVLAAVLAIAVAPLAAARSARDGAVATATAVTTDATITPLEGIDVSHWQNTIAWTKVAAAGKKFAIIKATESTTFTDQLYATNHAAAKAAGLWTGAYHFARPSTTANDAVLEADHFAAVMNLGAGDLLPALDLEDSGGLSVAALQAWVGSFLGEVTVRTGVRPMIYTSPAFWKKYMGDSHALADAGYTTLWIAHWNTTSPTVPANNWGGHGWTFWQYADCGSVPGISGCVDLDRFNGTDLTAQAYATFKLAAAIPSGSVKQGTSSAATVSIARTNFSADVALDVAGLPTGTTVSYDANPVSDTAAALTVTTPTDPTATPTGTYPLTITGVADGLTRTTTLNLVIADGIPPKLTAPTTSLVAGRTLGSTSVPVRVWWTPTDPSGIASAALQRSVSWGAWTGVALKSGVLTYADESLPSGATMRQRARATDRLANTSAWVQGPALKAAITQQTSTSVTWSGSWRTVSTSGASGGSLRYATRAGASATFRFTGSSVEWVAAKGTSRGSARILVDGKYAATVSLHATSTHYRAIVFACNWKVNGTHTIKIVVLGTAGHPRVDVDAFARLILR